MPVGRGPWHSLACGAGRLARVPACVDVDSALPRCARARNRGFFAGMPKRAMALRGGAPAVFDRLAVKEGDAVPDVVFKARVRDEKVPRTPPRRARCRVPLPWSRSHHSPDLGLTAPAALAGADPRHRGGANPRARAHPRRSAATTPSSGRT